MLQILPNSLTTKTFSRMVTDFEQISATQSQISLVSNLQKTICQCKFVIFQKIFIGLEPIWIPFNNAKFNLNLESASINFK